MNNKMILLLASTVVLSLTSTILLFPQISIGTEIVNSRGNIIVEMENFRNNDGNVLIALYNNAKGFPDKAETVMTLRADITTGKSKVIFKDIPYGIYAISGFHDENSNEKLDSGFFGIPKEGVLTSNNAVGKFGPPKFDDAKFELKTSNFFLTIDVKYY